MPQADVAAAGSPVRATAQLITGAVLISFSAVFVRLVSVPPTTSAFYRVLIGGAVLVILLVARREPATGLARSWLALLAAALFFALDLGFWHRSIALVGPGLATLLASFQVFVLAIAGVFFFGERGSAALWVSIPMALVGLGLIVGVDWNALPADYRWGVIFGLLTAATYGGYLLSLRRARVLSPSASPMVDLTVVSLATAVLLAISAGVEGESLRIPSWADGVWLTTYAVVAQVIGWLLISRSLPGLPASRVGLILLLQPLLSFVWDVVFFARPVSGREAVGAALALAAIYLGSRRPG